MSDIHDLYHQYFELDTDDEDQPICEVAPSQQQLNDSGGDSGVEAEAHVSSVSLALKLGFKAGLPMTFNLFRDRSGISPWDDPDAFADTDPLSPSLSKLRLHWHQFAGVHSIIRSVFTEEACPDHTTGVLVADEVGLGKTAQAIAFFAFLNTTIWLRQTKRSPQKILSMLFFMSTMPSSHTYVYSRGTTVSRRVKDRPLLSSPYRLPRHAHRTMGERAEGLPST